MRMISPVLVGFGCSSDIILGYKGNRRQSYAGCGLVALINFPIAKKCSIALPMSPTRSWLRPKL